MGNGQQVTHSVALEFAVGADVEQSAGGVIGSSTESIAIGEELDGIDVGVVRCKGLHTLLITDVPQLGEGIAGSGDKLVIVQRVYAQAHHITQVVGEFVDLGACLEIPEDAGHVARGGEDALVADESAAAEVTGMARQLPGDACWAFPRGEVVDGTNVVQTTTSDIVAGGGIRARHDPGRSERDGVDLVGGVCVPNDQLSILGGRDKMPSVGGPVHGVDLGQMTFEGPLRLHGHAREGLDSLLCYIANCGR